MCEENFISVIQSRLVDPSRPVNHEDWPVPPVLANKVTHRNPANAARTGIQYVEACVCRAVSEAVIYACCLLDNDTMTKAIRARLTEG